MRAVTILFFPAMLLVGAFDVCMTSPAHGGSYEVSGTDNTSLNRIGKAHVRAAGKREQPSLDEEITDLYSGYVNAKDRFQKATNLQYSLDVSIMYQWGSPDGGPPAGQLLLSPSVNWDFPGETPIGSGSLQFAYDFPWYVTSRNAENVQSNLGLITPVNDFPSNVRSFDQLTFTDVLPGGRASIVVGQYPVSDFDTNQYADNQQINFISYPLAQNGSSTYPVASLGAYAQVTPITGISFATGFQDANNVAGKSIQFNTFGDGRYTWFGYGQWNPQFRNLGTGQYSLLYYRSPSVPTQPSTSGWSVNGVQNLNDTWGLFLRANGASGFTTPIRTSIAGGGVWNDPLKRDRLDQIGLGIAWDQAARPPANPPDSRDEWVIEAYWAWTFFSFLQISPDFQLYIHPSLDPGRSSAWLLSLRTLLLF